MLTLIDTHAHLNDERYTNLDKIIAEGDQLKYIFTCAYDYASIIKNVEIANRYDKVFAIIGVHPHDAESYNKVVENEIIKNISNKKVIAIGEIGLDYHYEKNNANFENIKERQKQVFITQMRIAYKYKLPIVIHLRDAKEDMLKILQDNKELLKYGGVVHCFSEDVDFMHQILKLGLLISFTGIITFTNANALHEVVLNVPLNKFLLETDCPYLTPEPFRAKEINQPKLVKFVAEKVSQLKNISFEECAQIAYENACNLFKKVKDYNDAKIQL